MLAETRRGRRSIHTRPVLLYLVDPSELGVAHYVDRIFIMLAHDEPFILANTEPLSSNTDALGPHRIHDPVVMRYVVEELLAIGLLVLHRPYWLRYRVV
jgi:hypothetical protein